MFTTKSVLEFDRHELMDLVHQSAACVIVFCQRSLDEMSQDPIGQVLKEYLDCGDRVLADKLFAQVSLIYDFAKLALDDKTGDYRIYNEDVLIITIALQYFQGWKTAYVAPIDRDHGHWGRGSIVNQRDWTGLNKLLVQKFTR